jgi:putative Mg2+ transporter-C (MgtC) family protein
MYTAAFGATIIILVILAGVKPLERRFISVKQQTPILIPRQRRPPTSIRGSRS